MNTASSIQQTDMRSPSVPTQPKSSWGLLWGPALEDGAIINSPYEVQLFDPVQAFALNRIPYSWPTGQGGRLFVFPEAHTGRLEVWPMFTDDGASMTVQLFALTFTSRELARLIDRAADGGSGETSMIGISDRRNGLSADALGPAYNICRDASNSPATLTFTASDGETNNIVVPEVFQQPGDLVQTDITPTTYSVQEIPSNQLLPDGKPGCPYAVKPDYGVNYVSAPREIFDAAGFSGLFAWVPDVTVGHGLLLARVI